MWIFPVVQLNSLSSFKWSSMIFFFSSHGAFFSYNYTPCTVIKDNLPQSLKCSYMVSLAQSLLNSISSDF